MKKLKKTGQEQHEDRVDKLVYDAKKGGLGEGDCISGEV